MLNHVSHTTRSTISSLAVLLLACLLAYWPLTLGLYSLKNDALNYFLPVRYQISSAIGEGYFPGWSPYFNLGYPLHGDMQSGVWNPFVQLLSLAGPYTLRTLQIETLFYIWTSGAGMFFLARHFTGDQRSALLAGSAFMLCGYNCDSAQFLNWISAASFLPFVFLFYYRMLKERKWKHALLTALFLYLLFVTAYPADFVLTAYLLLTVLIVHLFSKAGRTEGGRQTGLHALLATCFFILSLPAIISYAEFLPLTQRGSGASYEQAMSNPLHPGLLISYLAPLAVWKAPFAVVTDPLTRNSFIGLIPFYFFLLSFFLKLPYPLSRFLRIGFIVSLLFSFGEWGLLRGAAFYVLPLMDTFRHPSNARLFTIFFACLLGAMAFGFVLTNLNDWRTRKKTWAGILVVLILLLLVSLSGWPLFDKISSNSFKDLIDSAGFHDLLFLSIMIQLAFMAWVYFYSVKKISSRFVLMGSIFNLVLFTALYQPFSVVKNTSVPEIQNLLDTLQQPGFPKPDLQSTIADNSREGMKYFTEIGAANMYNKKIGRVDYRITPSNLNSQNEFWFDTALREQVLQYPLFYRADTVISLSDTLYRNVKRKIIYVLQSGKENLSDSGTYTARVIEFNPQYWKIEVSSTVPGLYCLFQNHYPRWEAMIDGQPVAIIKSNQSFIGVEIPADKHTVEFRYRVNDLGIAWIISVVSLALILVFMFWKPGKQQAEGQLLV